MTEKEVKNYEAVKIATSHQIAIQNPNGEVISVEQLLSDMANDLAKIRKAILGQ